MTEERVMCAFLAAVARRIKAAERLGAGPTDDLPVGDRVHRGDGP